MPSLSFRRHLPLSEKDVDFLVETVAPEVTDKARLKEIIREDEDFRNTFLSEEKVFRRIMGDRDVGVQITPRLLFEVLLRRAVKDLERVGYTLEKDSTGRIPVFDSEEVVGLLHNESLLVYLVDMLSSFTKIRSYAVSLRLPQGRWRDFRFHDMDLPTLREFCDVVDEEHRLGLYKRIADICLFMVGMFPEYVERHFRYPFSRTVRPPVGGTERMGPEEYEEEGCRFYRLAAEHGSAKELHIDEVFWVLHREFRKAKKPLNFIAENYLHQMRAEYFGPSVQ